MATLRTTIGAAAVAMALALGACGSDDGNSTIEADPDDTTTTTVAEDTGTTVPDEAFDQFATATSLVDVPDDLPDGQYFGFITTLIAGHNEISGQFDLAELLFGDAAVAAAEAAGEEPLDFFIKNDNEKLRPILVDPEAVVNDVDYDACCEAQPSTPAQFVADRDADGEERTSVSIVVEDGTVTRIDEIYFP